MSLVYRVRVFWFLDFWAQGFFGIDVSFRVSDGLKGKKCEGLAGGTKRVSYVTRESRVAVLANG